jgi:uncharacterized phage-associated protein
MANVDDVAAALLQEGGKMDTYKLQKLLYYSQAWHLAITGRPLFDEPIEAWRQGPVVRKVFLGHRGKLKVSEWQGRAHALDENESAIVGLVRRHYGDLDGEQLSTLTHSEAPWLEARGDLPETVSSNAEVKQETMARFYRDRTLGGRYAADLAAGGVFLPTRDFKTERDEIRKEFIGIRESYRGTPAHHPEAPSLRRDQLASAGTVSPIVRAQRGKARPAR